MAQFSVTLAKIAEESNLTTLYAAKDLSETKVITAEVYRPGIMLAGYYQYFDRTRIQIIGLTELSYLQELDPEIRRTHLEKLFSFVPPAVILTRGLEPMPEMMEFAKKYGVPLLRSNEMTSPLMSSLITTLNTELAPRITRHGVLVEVAGEGILILGDSGVGKSETAIELVKRGHRLVADDAVELRKVSSHKIMGMAPANIRHFIELRGIGIINVARLFGAGAVKNSIEVEMVIELERGGAQHADPCYAGPEPGRHPGNRGNEQPPERNGLQRRQGTHEQLGAAKRRQFLSREYKQNV